MRSLEQARGGTVGGDGLVVLALCGEGVREADPGGTEMRVHHRGFGEEAAGLGDLVDAEVVDAHGEPRGRFVWVQVGETMGHEEQGVCLIELVQTREVEGVDGEVIFVRVEDGGSDGEGLFEATLGEEELGL